MNKKLLAVAVAGALAAPALTYAQSTVQIYGRVHQAWDSVNQGGITKDVVANAGGSHIGFKGTESLGGGLNAWFQGEQTMDVSNGTNSATTNFDRNSGVGLSANWGGVMIGNWDLPMKWTHVGGISIEDTGNQGRHAIVGGGAPTSVNTRTNIGTFYRRQQNVVQYWSPNFNGFEGRVAVTAGDEKVAGATGSPRTWGLGGMYKNGPLQVGLGYERHNDAVSQARSTSDTGWTVSAAYLIANVFRLSAMYERLTWESVSAVAGVQADRNAWGIYGDWAISGPHSLRAGYTKANSTSGNFSGAAPAAFGLGTSVIVFNGGAGNTGANMFAVSYQYEASKRTKLKINVSQINNDAAATYGYHITAGTAIPGSAAGQSARAYGIAVDHSF